MLSSPYESFREAVKPRLRVFIDNDYSGDPDDLFQTAHHLLSPSVRIAGILGSHLGPGDPWDSSGRSAANAVYRAQELLETMGMAGMVQVVQGSEEGLEDEATPRPSAGAEAIVAEAMREDELPLILACGAGLTDLASALMLEPRIAERMTLVWIGGNEHTGISAPPPEGAGPEYNLKIDMPAARSVFGRGDLRIWQVPRDVYRQCLMSSAELEAKVRPCGRLGRFLVDAIETARDRMAARGRNLGETYAMGDSPLVLLTALLSAYQPAPSSCSWVDIPRPALLQGGSYGQGTGEGSLRVFTRIDSRLMFEDFYAKLGLFAAGRGER